MGLNKSTLSEQIYQILRNDILTQKIPCGEKLTLKLLQERFQVSSTPIREALTRLTQDQLVSYYSNVGVRVISFTADDLREIYTFMGDLDGLAIRYASASPDQEKLQAKVTEILEKECAAAKAADVQTWNRYSDEFHLVFYRYCNNSRLAESAERLRSGISIFSNQYCRETVIQTRIDEEHLAIFQAYKDGDIEKAVQMMKTHLNDSLNYALRFLPKTF